MANLFCSGEVKNKIGHNEGFRGAVKECNIFVRKSRKVPAHDVSGAINKEVLQTYTAVI